MKILIGVDDSPHSRAAVEFARRMAWPKDSTIKVLSMVRPVIAMYAEAYVPAPTCDGQRRLVRGGARAVQCPGGQARRTGGTGNPARRATQVDAATTRVTDRHND